MPPPRLWESMARTTQYTEAAISRVSSASGLSNRNISAATGVKATRDPAISPAAAPDHRFTAAYTRATVPTPINACGSSSENDEKPRMRPEIAMNHSDAGGLSTVIEFAESSEPNSSAFQDWVPALTAAA